MAGLHGKPIEPRRRTTRRPHAPVAKARGVPTISALPNIFHKEGLSWGAAKETALFAVHHRDEWEGLSDEAAVDRLYKHHKGIWDGRKAMGTLVHEVNECWSWSETIEVEEVISSILAAKSPPQIWMGREAEVAQEALGYIDGLEKFWLDFEPETVATEEVVRHDDKPNTYVGQRDWVFRAEGRLILAEIKTTGQQDAERGLYPDQWRMQLALQKFAESIVLYDEDNNEEGTAPNYPVDSCCVLHLRGDGNYQLLELQVGMSEWTRALQARGLWTWLRQESKKPSPIVVPSPVREVVA